MRKLLPIALLLLYAGMNLAAPVTPVTAGFISLTTLRDTTILPITTLLSITHASPAGHPTIAGPLHPSPTSGIPDHTVAASPSHLTLRLSNPSTAPITHIALEWELQVNGISRQKGTTGPLVIAPRQSTLLRLPVRWPGGDTNEIYLRLRYRQATRPNRPAGSHPPPPGPILGEEQLLVQTPAGNTLEVHPDGELTFTDVNDTFTILSPLIHIEFNKQTGWMQRYEAGGAVLLTDTPVLKSNFWRPPNRPPSGTEASGGGAEKTAANDAGASGDTTTVWQEASHDAHLQLFSTSTGNTMIIVRAEYTLPATSCLLHVSYTINAKGEMLIGQQMEADSTQKGWPLPCFGMRWLLPANYDSIDYYGPGGADSTSSYSDSTKPRDSIRLHAPWIGIYHYIISQPPSPDSHQRNSVTTADGINAIRWIRIAGPDGNGLLLSADSTLFNAGALQTHSSVLLHIDSRQPAAPFGRPPSGAEAFGGGAQRLAAGDAGDNRQISYGLPYGNYRCTYKISPINLHPTSITGHP